MHRRLTNKGSILEFKLNQKQCQSAEWANISGLNFSYTLNMLFMSAITIRFEDMNKYTQRYNPYP